ncbi:DNA/RNA polymerase [Hypoxylon sp. NC1633]|nr:DNA/RNA polymerase [Hypoxylon sp. NC1633]
MKTTALTSGRSQTITGKTPKRSDNRVILHFDYDCFYASVFENLNPSLKGLPVGVKQKSILATCNYPARARGVKKLGLISEAQKVCPEIVILNGEDLTPFRDASKKLWSVLRSHSWNSRVERLGLDEVFLDVTDVIEYNLELLNRNTLANSFFQLSRQDPERGFSFDGSQFFGCVEPPVKPEDVSSVLENPLGVRLLLGSHLAGYLRHKLEEDFGYTSSGGISTNKVLAKVAGSKNKPKNQTTLLGLRDDDVYDFMDGHKLRQIPGIGSRTAHLIQEHVLAANNPGEPRAYDAHNLDTGAQVTVGQVRRHAGMCADQLERILDRPGVERGSGERIWALLHGADGAEVKEASDVPTQISIEDTYMARPLNTPAEVARELRALATSLVRRMRVDLVADDSEPESSDAASQQNQTQSQQQSQPRWAAYPKTLRLSTRTRPKPGARSSATETFSRSSRSQALPSFVLSLRDESVEAVGSRLATEVLQPLFRRLNPERHGWNLALINVCVTNMVMVAGPGESGGGPRDIARMFRTQEDKLREWTVYDTAPVPVPVQDTVMTSETSANAASPVEEAVWVEEEGEEEDEKDGGMEIGAGAMEAGGAEMSAAGTTLDVDADAGADVDVDAWDDDDGEESQVCHLCGHAIPLFAVSAHERFHAAVGDC